MRYADPSKPPGYFYALSHPESTCSFVEHDVDIRNARLLEKPFTLAQNGLELVKQTTAVTDFFDESQVETIYKPEVEALVKRLTGAGRVIVFHAVARDEGPNQRAGWRPARNAHIDYPAASYRAWAADELGAEEAEKLMSRPWSAINVWRGIRTVESAPLAVCDPSTVEDSDFIDVPIWLRPGEKHFPEVCGRNMVMSPRHRWYYYPYMTPAEALVFRLADSDESKPRFAAHSAFDDPTTLPDAAPRMSFEVRTLAFF
ncbi:MAG TPA: CmcJ/NvfI family oxidoreductase [Ramlibacter sp.]